MNEVKPGARVRIIGVHPYLHGLRGTVVKAYANRISVLPDGKARPLWFAPGELIIEKQQTRDGTPLSKYPSEGQAGGKERREEAP